jgi:hypothetical protein
MGDRLANGVLRISTAPDVEFYYAQLVMQACGKPSVLLWNLELDVAGDGAPLPYGLPTDVGVSAEPVAMHWTVELRARVRDGAGRTLEVRTSSRPGDPLVEEEEVEEAEIEDGFSDSSARPVDDWKPRAELTRSLVQEPNEIGETPITIRIHDGVSGAEAVALVDELVAAGATQLLFTGVHPR